MRDEREPGELVLGRTSLDFQSEGKTLGLYILFTLRLQWDNSAFAWVELGLQLALAAGRLPRCWALTPVHTQGTSGSGGIHAALSKGSRTCLLMLLHSQAGAQALALPCSSFPLFQHFSPHSLPRTCTARWPDPGSANQTPLVCWAHGRKAAPYAT